MLPVITVFVKVAYIVSPISRIHCLTNQSRRVLLHSPIKGAVVAFAVGRNGCLPAGNACMCKGDVLARLQLAVLHVRTGLQRLPCTHVDVPTHMPGQGRLVLSIKTACTCHDHHDALTSR